MSDGPRYRRVLLKLSGEALMGERTHGIDPAVLSVVAADIAGVPRLGASIGVVVGGGNLFRGAAAAGAGHDRATADYMGMLATVMNALALQESLEAIGCPVRVQSALRIDAVVEPYVRRRALKHLERGRVVIFAAGTGSPFFTTDTAATLRAAEINADLVLKATKVDGVYSKDPFRYPDAVRYDRLSYDEVLSRRLEVMDATAVALCREQKLPLRVFNIRTRGDLARIVNGESVGTLVCEGEQ